MCVFIFIICFVYELEDMISFYMQMVVHNDYIQLDEFGDKYNL